MRRTAPSAASAAGECLQVARRAGAAGDIRAGKAEDRRRAGSLWRETGPVHTTGTAEPCDPRNALRVLEVAATKAGLPHAGMHTLRPPAASVMLTSRGLLEVMSEILGHSSIAITGDVCGHARCQGARQQVGPGSRSDAVVPSRSGPLAASVRRLRAGDRHEQRFHLPRPEFARESTVERAMSLLNPALQPSLDVPRSRGTGTDSDTGRSDAASRTVTPSAGCRQDSSDDGCSPPSRGMSRVAEGGAGGLHLDEALTTVRLPAGHASVLAALLAGAWFTLVPFDEPAGTATVDPLEVVVETLRVTSGSPAVGLTQDEAAPRLGADAALLGVIDDRSPELVDPGGGRAIRAGTRS